MIRCYYKWILCFVLVNEVWNDLCLNKCNMYFLSFLVLVLLSLMLSLGKCYNNGVK